MIACRDCDALHRYQPLSVGEKACCKRCGALLYERRPHALERSLACALAALVCFLLANLFPFLSLEIAGRMEQNLLISGALALYRAGMAGLGLTVFLTAILFPLLILLTMIYLQLPLYFNRQPPFKAAFYRLIHGLNPWSMISVFMLATLIAYVKLQDMATVIPGTALFFFVAAQLFYAAAMIHFDRHALWPHRHFDQGNTPIGATSAREAGLFSCPLCHALCRDRGETEPRCPRCQTRLAYRKPDSLNRTWALLCTAALLLIPANLYPVMTLIRLGQGEPSTILGGIVHLMDGGMWGLAFIVLFASFVVPISKIGSLMMLLITIRRQSAWRPADRTALYRVTGVVGAWSMVDIYVVAILAALVNLQALATVEPGIGAIFFAAAVVTTMLAAHSFDPRLIWDHRPSRPSSREFANAN